MRKAISKTLLSIALFGLIFANAVCTNIYFVNSDESAYTKSQILCRGNVVIIYCGRIISADEISYDKISDTVFANGNVIIKDEKQNVYFLDSIKVQTNFESGEGKNIKIIMTDKSRLAAKACVIKNKKFELDNVIYTPCYECVAFDELTWQVKSSHVSFDPNDSTEYEDAKFELLGQTILYLPHLSQPSPKITRKTGFLAPKLSVSSISGFSVLLQYFINVAPSQELILKPMITSKIGNVAWMYYGTRFKNGEFDIDASITGTKSVKNYSNTDDFNKKLVEKIQKSGYRGHMFSKIRYEIDDVWRCRLDANLVSDRSYLKRFPFIRHVDRILESKALFEGLDGRNYTSLKTSMFQCDSSDILPKVIPVIERNISTTLFDGTFDIDVIFMNLDFNNSRSTQKVASNVSWTKSFMMPCGNIIDFKGLATLKAMKVLEKQRSEYDSFACATPQASVAWKWPLLMRSDSLETIFTPVVGIIAASNKKYFDAFEDQFCEVNDINFLNGSRAMSPYNIDYGSRVCYGTKISSYMNGQNLGYFTVGRSTELTAIAKRLDATGMKNKNSNIVTSGDVFLSDEITFTVKGSYSTKTKRWLKCEYGVGFSNDNFDANIMIFNGKQCYYNPFLANISTLAEEEKVQKYKGSMIDVGWKTSKTLKLKAGLVFGNEKNKLIKHSVGMEYKNECTQLEVSIERTNYRSGDIKPDTSLRLVVHLKNLGI